jgi:hypothetical protein
MSGKQKREDEEPACTHWSLTACFPNADDTQRSAQPSPQPRRASLLCAEYTNGAALKATCSEKPASCSHCINHRPATPSSADVRYQLIHAVCANDAVVASNRLTGVGLGVVAARHGAVDCPPAVEPAAGRLRVAHHRGVVCVTDGHNASVYTYPPHLT